MPTHAKFKSSYENLIFVQVSIQLQVLIEHDFKMELLQYEYLLYCLIRSSIETLQSAI